MQINMKENYTIYGKVICTHCGSDHELMHVGTPFGIESIICKTCFHNEIPSGDDVIEMITKEILATFEIEEITEFKNFEEMWSIIDSQNAYEDDWNQLRLEYKGLYLNAYLDILQGLNDEQKT